jgi:hypothetical protein
LGPLPLIASLPLSFRAAVVSLITCSPLLRENFDNISIYTKAFLGLAPCCAMLCNP